jgi:hypothetical protein
MGALIRFVQRALLIAFTLAIRTAAMLELSR